MKHSSRKFETFRGRTFISPLFSCFLKSVKPPAISGLLAIKSLPPPHELKYAMSDIVHGGGGGRGYGSYGRPHFLKNRLDFEDGGIIADLEARAKKKKRRKKKERIW